MATQWRVGPQGPVGLDYAALGETAKFLGIDITEDVFKKIRVLEDEYIGSVYNLKAEDAPGAQKSCRGPDVCAMCRKTCNQRFNA